MEIKIGIRNVAREISIDVNMTVEEVTKEFTTTRNADGLMHLTDSSGRQTLIPAVAIAYIEFPQEHARQVGFGTMA